MSNQKKAVETVPAIVEWFKLGKELKDQGFNIKLNPVKSEQGDWGLRGDTVAFTPAFHIYANKTARINNATAKVEEFQRQIDDKEALIAKAHATKKDLEELQEIYNGMEFDQDDINSLALKTAKETEIRALENSLGDYEGFVDVYTEHVNQLKALQKPFLEELELANAVEVPKEREYPLA